MAVRKKKKKGKSSLFILGALIFSLLAYAGVLFQDQLFDPDPTPASTSAKPWYKEHVKKPELIRAPDAPLIIAATEAEIDDTITELTPKQPLKTKQTPAPQPRLANIDISSKPTPPAQAVFYEEALPNDVYAPVIAIAEQPSKPANNVTTQQPAALSSFEPRWMKYAVKMTPAINKPMIALVIDDLGLDRKRTAQTLALKGPLTMAFIPYAKNLNKQTTAAKANGHELLVHLPMEPLNKKIDAGPNHLHTHLAHEDLLDRIHWNLERFEGYVGVNNHMGSLATTDPEVMSALMTELRKREMLFLDSRTNPKSIATDLAGKEGVPFAVRNVFLDNVNEKGAVLKQLSLLEKVARRSGFAVGIGHPRDGTIAALKEWLPSIERNGFSLVPISQIVLHNQGLS
ncbi:divergent polysaccharide deacetylase family protein [Terasakiella pusilla]|uniref:divergent polysaccharide deacetylase family protein n=1 Tax=Terasakiella pusilla TaxID=64973 RepID=UPI003AA86C26